MQNGLQMSHNSHSNDVLKAGTSSMDGVACTSSGLRVTRTRLRGIIFLGLRRPLVVLCVRVSALEAEGAALALRLAAVAEAVGADASGRADRSSAASAAIAAASASDTLPDLSAEVRFD
jgi:hypothetical protein